jgi:XTP/dITP diphosphohydrolase
LLKRRKFIGKSLVIASHNAGKINEITALLSPFGIEVLNAAVLNLPIPDETGSTYLENAIIKAQACTMATNLPCIADDSGVEVAALGNAPGVDTAPYTIAHGGREQVFSLWEKNPAIKENPAAQFVCVQVLAWPDGHLECFESAITGHLSFPPRGAGGHGYDPVFVPEGFRQTMAEMPLEEKNLCSHRFLAFQKLIKECFV